MTMIFKYKNRYIDLLKADIKLLDKIYTETQNEVVLNVLTLKKAIDEVKTEEQTIDVEMAEIGIKNDKVRKSDKKHKDN